MQTLPPPPGAAAFWDERWRSEDGRCGWEAPDPAVVARVAGWREQGLLRVLDLGCGIGRHSLLLAAAGFQVTAVDASPGGLAELAAQAAHAGLAITTLAGTFAAVPQAHASQDLVLAWNAIYHADRAGLDRHVAEICRVLRPGGLLCATLISRRHRAWGRGQALDAATWIDPGHEDKAHPHCYLDEDGVRQALRGFILFELDEVELSGPGTWHWRLMARHRQPAHRPPGVPA